MYHFLVTNSALMGHFHKCRHSSLAWMGQSVGGAGGVNVFMERTIAQPLMGPAREAKERPPGLDSS